MTNYRDSNIGTRSESQLEEISFADNQFAQLNFFELAFGELIVIKSCARMFIYHDKNYQHTWLDAEKGGLMGST